MNHSTFCDYYPRVYGLHSLGFEGKSWGGSLTANPPPDPFQSSLGRNREEVASL